MSIKSRFREKLRGFLGIHNLESRLDNLAAQDLVRDLQKRAAATTAEFIEKNMVKAKALDSTLSVIDFALEKMCAATPGLFCEFGVFEGRTINHVARQTKARVYGFDSFKGLPEAWRDGFPAGTFGLAEGLPKCEWNVELVVGWFEETLPGFVKAHPDPVVFLHVDCDLYSSTKTVFANLGHRLVPGSVIVFDEYFNYPGWQEHEHRAFREFVEANNLRFEYLCYNRFHEQVAVKIL